MELVVYERGSGYTPRGGGRKIEEGEKTIRNIRASHECQLMECITLDPHPPSTSLLSPVLSHELTLVIEGIFPGILNARRYAEINDKSIQCVRFEIYTMQIYNNVL